MEQLYSQIKSQIDRKWDEHREVLHNSKGDRYEDSFADLLETYYGGVYDFNTKVVASDSNREVFKQFDFNGDEEIDVVATFKQSKPRVLLSLGQEENSLKWVPFESMAFMCEIKANLTKKNLENDFKKLEPITKVSEGLEDRFGVTASGNYCVDYPLRCLVYDEESISQETMSKILENNIEFWDLILLVKKDLLIVNHKLPIADYFKNRLEKSNLFDGIVDRQEIKGNEDAVQFYTVSEGILWFLVAVSASIPDPIAVNTVESLLSVNDKFRIKKDIDLDLDGPDGI